MKPLSKDEFNRLAQTGVNRIPLVNVLLADMDTPLSIYLKLANQPYSYLFESAYGGEKSGRYSVIGLAANCRLKVYGQQIILEEGERKTTKKVRDPLEYINTYLKTFKVAQLDYLPKFSGGLVGYFGYETIHYIEPKIKCRNTDQQQTPDILLMVSEKLLIVDNLLSCLFVIVYADPNINNAYENTYQTLEELTKKLQNNKHSLPKFDINLSAPSNIAQPFTYSFPREEYLQAVEKARQYIIDGDAMQIVLSQRLSTPFTGSSINLYRALRHLNPSPYMFYMHMDDHYIVGASPEILVRLEENKITIRPIAGTRPRGTTMEQDNALEQELLCDPKELAEHLMLIDLGRNDVGRVSQIGSVNLTDKMLIERYSHVMHIVSNVEGILQPNLSAIDVLRAAFPAGTLSGAPKIRAMEIIDELEPVKRGVYGGAIGYLAWNGNMDTAIAIRTAVIKNDTLYIQAGAGIVYDSIANKEWEETINKGQSILRALSMSGSEDYCKKP